MLPTGLLAILSLYLLQVHAAKAPLNVTFPNVSTTAVNVVNDNFLGISFELSPFNTLWGETPTTMANAMKNYLSNVRARMSNPLRIRIGGNGMDSSTYVPDQTNMITDTDPDAYYNDVPVDFGPVFFEVLNAMADAVGSMEYIIGLSMQDPSDDGDVIELAAAARSMLGSRLDAMLLGNEPDLYAGHGTRTNYTIQDYIPEIGEVLNDLANSQYGNLTNETLIGGPTICCSWDLDEVLEAGLDQYAYKYYTLQHYPTYVCDGYNSKTSNISYYISHVNVEPFLQWNDGGIEMAKRLGVPMLLTEYNSASCGGDPTVAPTFAAALWAIDVALKAASLNFSAVYLHTREYNISYNLFDPPSATTPTHPGWRTGAVYYAMLVVAEAISNTSSVISDLDIAKSNTNTSATVAAYGIYDGANFTKSKFVLFNFAYPREDQGESADDVVQTFQLPANLTHAVGVRYLIAPNITEQTNITWAGQTVGTNGDLQNGQETDYRPCRNGCSIDVPGPGMALIWLDPREQGENIYVGNSTIAGIDNDNDSGGARVKDSALTSLWTIATMFSVLLVLL